MHAHSVSSLPVFWSKLYDHSSFLQRLDAVQEFNGNGVPVMAKGYVCGPSHKSHLRSFQTCPVARASVWENTTNPYGMIFHMLPFQDKIKPMDLDSVFLIKNGSLCLC